jgi:hypothetical protein
MSLGVEVFLLIVPKEKKNEGGKHWEKNKLKKNAQITEV